MPSTPVTVSSYVYGDDELPVQVQIMLGGQAKERTVIDKNIQEITVTVYKRRKHFQNIFQKKYIKIIKIKKKCEGSVVKDKLVFRPMPATKQISPKSIVSENLLAYDISMLFHTM